MTFTKKVLIEMKIVEKKFAQVEILLDVVFGIILSFGIINLLKHIGEYIGKFRPNELITDELITIVLFLITITFVVFYWFEIKEFIVKNEEIDNYLNVKKDKKQPIYYRLFLFGIIIMIIFCACMFEFSRYDYFMIYLCTNIFYWISDFFGTLLMRKKYKKHTEYFVQKCNNPNVIACYFGHFVFNFFLFYGIANVVAYFLLIIIYFYMIRFSINLTFYYSLFIFAYTSFRHVIWRILIYNNYIKNKIDKLDKNNWNDKRFIYGE